VNLPVFVYGSLMSAGDQGALLGSLGRSAARARGALYHLPAGYPALMLGADDVVYGELVEAPGPRLLALLDQYEGVSEGLFSREQIDVEVGLRRVKAWAYVMERPEARGAKRLKSGRWRCIRRR
jgi:gamma-glutamylcyclotransferase (GGCT)/AIG2-like uncharacterized protein YtfP